MCMKEKKKIEILLVQHEMFTRQAVAKQRMKQTQKFEWRIYVSIINLRINLYEKMCAEC